MKKQNNIYLNSQKAQSIQDAALSSSIVSGLTHDFYRYPARFSPIFTREIIQNFTKPGDLVLDPFVGGGTTIVEARALGRCAIGVDINSLATFVTKAKTTSLVRKDVAEISTWKYDVANSKHSSNSIVYDAKWNNYFRNIECEETSPIKRAIQFYLQNIDELTSINQQRFLRCALLKTAQWALDSNEIIPSSNAFKEKFNATTDVMLRSILDYSSQVRKANSGWSLNGLHRQKIFNRSTVDINSERRIATYPKPKLILTSPPYPGVHVLYHRWQVHGRRETPAPYWIADVLDGSGASYYTFGSRHEETLTSYFENAFRNFHSVAKIASKHTTVVQMIAFSDPSWQLPLYLEVLEDAGLYEVKIPNLANHRDGRLWRTVPNRKWHAAYKGATPSSKEVVLFHKLK